MFLSCQYYYVLEMCLLWRDAVIPQCGQVGTSDLPYTSTYVPSAFIGFDFVCGFSKSRLLEIVLYIHGF